MLKTVLKSLLGLGLLIVSEACAGVAPIVPTLNANAINTSIAGTMAAASTQTAQVKSRMETPSPTVTSTPTLSATPFPTFTLVIAAPQVYVSKSTHCRAGPGQVYDSLGALRAGEAVQIVGRSADAKYWIIRNPRNPSEFCWLSGKYATISGVAGLLPVFTAPPRPTATRTPKPPTRTPQPSAPPQTPQPSFAASYSSAVNCPDGNWYVQVDLTNNGAVTFQSILLLVEDTVSGDVFALASDDFISNNTCAQDLVDTMPPGAFHKVSLPALTYDPHGRTLNVGISICSETAQNGSCAAQVITFTP